MPEQVGWVWLLQIENDLRLEEGLQVEVRMTMTSGAAEAGEKPNDGE